MPNDTRSGLKISGNRSDGGMNPPQSPDLKEEVWNVLQEAWRTIPEDYLKK